MCSRFSRKSYVIDALVQRGSVNISVGDSGIGKSPLHYQMGCSVASGLPFLGYTTSPGVVVYLDYENGLEDMHRVLGGVSQHLGLSSPPENFLLKTFDGSSMGLGEIIAEIKPALCIIDTLRMFKPEAEEKNSNAAAMLSELHTLARKHGTAFQLIHHPKKPGEAGFPPLEDTPTLTWLFQACGARALINQTDVRIGIDVAKGMDRLGDRQEGSRAEIALVFKAFFKSRGEIGPIYLERVFDENGDEPLGYRQLSGVNLLFNPEQRASFGRLPDEEFRFKQAKAIYGRGDQPTRDFLQKCIRIGILHQPAYGRYSKVKLENAESGAQGQVSQ